MSKFSETVKQDTPRLVVLFKRDDKGEQFQWGLAGKIPLLSLVGYITKVQAELYFRSPHECPEQALVIAWDDATRTCEWFCHPDVPDDATVGMLETIKATLLATQMARNAASQQLILGPDGQPVRK